MVGLSEEADKQLSKLSGKNKRAVIGKALVSKADLLCWMNLLLIESHGTHY